jgi:primary-amine oxidase
MIQRPISNVAGSGTDPSLWSVRKAVYGDQIFYDTKTLNDAFHKGDLKPLPHPKADNITWASRDEVGPPRPLDDRAGPRNVAFDGARLQAEYVVSHFQVLSRYHFLSV